jgi:hypothetical protein
MGNLARSFRCPCKRNCFQRAFQIVAIQPNTPAKFDLTSVAFAKKINVCLDLKTPVQMKALPTTHTLNIILSKRETQNVLAISYTIIMLMADVANSLGLFFGLSVISLYEAMETAYSQSRHLHSVSKFCTVVPTAKKVKQKQVFLYFLFTSFPSNRRSLSFLPDTENTGGNVLRRSRSDIYQDDNSLVNCAGLRRVFYRLFFRPLARMRMLFGGEEEDNGVGPHQFDSRSQMNVAWACTWFLCFVLSYQQVSIFVVYIRVLAH